MANLVRVPISNVPMGGGYTAVITVGANRAALAVLLDTGSSTLAIDGQHFDPLAASDSRTTNLAQTVQYGAGSWVGAVVQTSVSLAADVALPAVNLAVTYAESAGMFGGAQGILGLAYAPLDSAYLMPADSWTARYDASHLAAGTVVDLDPYFTQLEQAGVVGNTFAFAVRRAAVSLATDDPATDPLNRGLLVLGGGEEAADLYTGGFTQLAVVHDRWYNTNLLSVQVGDQPAIAVAPLADGSPLASNSIVDSGTNVLLFDQPIYDAMIAAFTAIDPGLAAALGAHGVGATTGLAHDQLDLAAWPALRLTLQGADDAPATLTITPACYWQPDAARRGEALHYLAGAAMGRAILGLPLFAGYYAVFDRALGAGRGVVSFATHA